MKQLDTGGATRTEFQLTGRRLTALQSGPQDGAPVLLLPGYTGSKEDFGPLLDPLGTAGFRATAIDLPGQYESPGPDDLAAYSPDALGAVVAELAAALGAPVRLLGHSFGGLVARAAVLARPDAFDSLVLMSSGPGAIGGGRRSLIEQLAPVLATHGLAGVYAASQAAETAAPGYVAPPADLAAFLRTRFLAGSPAMLQGMGDALRAEPDRTAALAAIGIRTLVLHGVNDDAWPPAVQYDMARRLGARYVVVPGAGHSPAVENPTATVAELLAFWCP